LPTHEKEDEVTVTTDESRSDAIALITEEQIPAAGEVLARAFADFPLSVHAQPDPELRHSPLSWWLAELIRQRTQATRVYTHAPGGHVDGVAVWMLQQTSDEVPGGPSADQMEERWGAAAAGRLAIFGEIQAVHVREMAGTPHWYLFILGVAPEAQGQGVGSALLAPVLQQADRERVPCYLETMTIDNVRFYERRNFAVVDSGETSGGEVPFWSMRREPVGETRGSAR
jgi:GNAT superfamily N-acetyltransferase